MNIHIPDWLVAIPVYLLIATMAAALFAILIWLIIYALKRRRVWWVARVWLTTKRSKQNAEEYTYGVLSNIAHVLKRDDPQMSQRLAWEFGNPKAVS